ncbi:acyltransferase family protein [Pseudoalteromonas sp. MER144-MNA-CIBAN-0113]|uniref:acyltransferase family protein n=1 Tax=Pseudoalteromonas sp. MER144-MNA-CIBAN-0113 TaxID=3140429 RepID=UPI00331CFC3C
MKYRAEIDGLRALAILPVLFHHSGLHLLPGGFAGVDVFFVISGYLITTILLKEISEGKFSLSSFYERRARRILPAMAFMIVVSSFLSFFFLDPASMKMLGYSIVAVSTFMANIFFFLKLDYFNPSAELNPMLHMWSLAVEEQFYLFFPFILLLLTRFKKHIFLALSVILIISLLSMFLTSNQSVNFYLIHTRAWELLAGSICSVLITKNALSAINESLKGWLSILAILLLIISYSTYSYEYAFPGWFTILPVISTALIILFASENNIVGKMLSSKILVFIGLISYSLYLWHQPIFAFAKLMTLESLTNELIALSMLIVFLLSLLSYQYVEKPFRRKSNKSTKTVLTLSVFSLLVMSVMGLLLSLYPKFGGFSKAEITQSKPSIGLNKLCNFKSDFQILDECKTSENPETILWGDSYAMHLVKGLSKNNELIQATKSACSPNVSLSTFPNFKSYNLNWSKSCFKFNNDVINEIENNSQIKTVILSSAFEQWFKYDYFDGTRVLKNDFDAYLISFKQTLSRLSSTGKRIFVVSPPPNNGKNIGQCLLRKHYNLISYSDFIDNNCTFQKNEFSQYYSKILHFLKDVESYPNVKLIDLSKSMCSKSGCVTFEQNSLYLDTGHLNDFGSEYVGKIINPIIN